MAEKTFDWMYEVTDASWVNSSGSKLSKPGLVLSVEGNTKKDGTNVVAKNASTTGAQKWYLE